MGGETHEKSRQKSSKVVTSNPPLCSSGPSALNQGNGRLWAVKNYLHAAKNRQKPPRHPGFFKYCARTMYLALGARPAHHSQLRNHRLPSITPPLRHSITPFLAWAEKTAEKSLKIPHGQKNAPKKCQNVPKSAKKCHSPRLGRGSPEKFSKNWPKLAKIGHRTPASPSATPALCTRHWDRSAHVLRMNPESFRGTHHVNFHSSLCTLHFALGWRAAENTKKGDKK